MERLSHCFEKLEKFPLRQQKIILEKMGLFAVWQVLHSWLALSKLLPKFILYNTLEICQAQLLGCRIVGYTQLLEP